MKIKILLLSVSDQKEKNDEGICNETTVETITNREEGRITGNIYQSIYNPGD